MQILHLNKKDKELSFILHTIEDLWGLKSIVDAGDIISGLSERRQRQENLSTSERKKVYVSILIEKFDYSSELNSLRFTGVIISSKPEELAPLGEHHTLEIKFNEKYYLKKNNLFDYQINILKKIGSMSSKLIAVIIDDEGCDIFELSDIGISSPIYIPSGKSGKRYKQDFNYNTFFENIYLALDNTKDSIVIAGPGRTKNKLQEFLLSKDNLLKTLIVNIQNTSKSSINELFTKKEVSKFFNNSIIYKENEYLEKFLKHLGKDSGKSVYGLKEVEKGVVSGATEFILITENLWKNKLDDIQKIILEAEKFKTKIHVVDSNHPITQTLISFGGIIAVLRYKLL